MMIISKKNEKKCLLVKKELKEFPAVTVQLPIFNEKYVAARVIRAAMKLDYPKKNLEFQVLDDSTDETLDISRKLVEEYSAKGYNISLIHRKERTGQKGGALKEAMPRAKGDFILIYDADFIPSHGIIKALLPYFLDDKSLGMVQTRWGHLNPGYSSLTAAQSLLIDGHFAIEQVARGGSKLFMNFNGTAGMWRKECIYDAGNWSYDTVTEDFDLSYRANLKKWRMRYIRDIENKAELPVQMTAYKIQQFRWAKGGMQTTKKLLGRIFASRNSLLVKFEALIHLTYYMIHPLMILNILISGLIISNESIFNNYYYMMGNYFWTAIIVFFFGHTLVILYSDWYKKLYRIPLAMVFGTGLAVNNAWAVLDGLFGKSNEFIRTPKFGIITNTGKWQDKKYSKKNLRVTVTMILEAFLGVYSLYGGVMAFIYQRFQILPLFILYTASFFTVFIMGFVQNLNVLSHVKEKKYSMAEK